MSEAILAAMAKVEWEPVLDQHPTTDADVLPYVTHEGTLDLNGIKIRVLQLSDGQRIIPADELTRVILGNKESHSGLL